MVAYIEFSEASTFLVDLVITNFGATAAHDVYLEIDPTPRRSIDDERQENSPAAQPEYVWLPDRIPVLVPGQEWRTLWDTGRRIDTDLPDRHVATIRFSDSQGESYGTEAVLDWRMVKDREPVTIYGAHHAAQALRDISKSIARWKEGASGGLAVYVRDGDAKDQRQREAREARLGDRQSGADDET